MIKTTGAEWKAFMHDDPFWGEWAFDDHNYNVNGREIGMDLDEDTLADTDVVKVDGGYVYDQENADNTDSLSAFFKRWRKQQSTEFLSVEVPKEKAEAVRAAIINAGGKVK